MNHTNLATDLLTHPYALGPEWTPEWTQPFVPCTEMTRWCLLSVWTLYLLDALMVAWVCRSVYSFVCAVIGGPRATHRETPGHRRALLRRSPRLLALARARERGGGVCPP